jgi:hypothetical protein
MREEFADEKIQRTMPELTARRLDLMQHMKCSRCHTQPATCLRGTEVFCRACSTAARIDREVLEQREQVARMQAKVRRRG